MSSPRGEKGGPVDRPPRTKLPNLNTTCTCNQAQPFHLQTSTHVHLHKSRRRINDSLFQVTVGMTSRRLRSQKVTSPRTYVGRKDKDFLDVDRPEGIAIDWISSIKPH